MYNDSTRRCSLNGYFWAWALLWWLGTASGAFAQDAASADAFQKAAELIRLAPSSRTHDQQQEGFQQAVQLLEAGLKTLPPESLEAAEWRLQLGKTWLGKSRAALAAIRLPGMLDKRSELNTLARSSAEKARQECEAAQKTFDASVKEFAAFIDAKKDPEKFAARERAELGLVNSMLDASLALLTGGRALEAGSAAQKQQLESAANEFEQIRSRYRQTVAGRFARLHQAKCYEEQGDVQKAMGIYDEILKDEVKKDGEKIVQDLARLSRLTLLNEKKTKADHEIVVSEGEQWLKQRAGASGSTAGIGMRFELAVAYEALGDNKDFLRPDQERYWRQALGHARIVNKFAGEFREGSMQAIQRLEKQLGTKEKLPDKFKDALDLGRQQFGIVKDMKTQLEVARQEKDARRRDDDVRRLEQDIKNETLQAIQYLERAVERAGPAESDENVAAARYLLGYVYYLEKRSYEAAVLCEYASRTPNEESPDAPLDAAWVALAAWLQAYSDGPGSEADKQAELQQVERLCQDIAKRSPESERANDARMMLGKVYSKNSDPLAAAKWFSEVPEADSQYADAQLAAGQSFWMAYLRAASPNATVKHTPEELVGWKANSGEYLKRGIAKLGSGLDPKMPSTPELTAAKMSLSQILISEGQDAEAVNVLTLSPHAVVDSIKVDDESKRPEKGVQSRNFASEALKLLLRAYIATGKLEEARGTMKTLETVAGAGGGDLTQLYVGLGKLLKEELERFKATGETERYDSLMTSFERFLAEMLSRKDGQNYGTLSWIGETYAALGESANAGNSKAAEFHGAAASAFREIVARNDSTAGFATPQQLTGVQLRLGRSLRLQSRYDQAEVELLNVVKNKPDDLTVQMEAAQLYLDWGLSGGDDATARLLKALSGVAESGIWGWAQLSTRLQQAAERTGREDRVEQFLEARYNVAICRRAYANLLPDAKKRKSQLSKAGTELVATVAVTKELSPAQRERLNGVYRDIQTDLGGDVVDLPMGGEVPLTSTDTADAADSEKAATAKKTKKPKTAAAPAKPADSGIVGYAITGLVMCGVVAGGYFMIRKPKRVAGSKRKADAPPATFTAMAPLASPAADDGFSLDSLAIPAAKKAAARPAAAIGTASAAVAKPRPASATGPAAGGAAPARPAAPRPAAAPPASPGAQAPAPRPRPPGEAPAKPKPPQPPAG